MTSPASLSEQYLEHYRLKRHVVLHPRSLISPLFPTGFLMSAGFQEIDSLVRGERSTPQRATVVQPCFRYFDALGTSRSQHLSLFLMGAALYGPESAWTQNEALDSLLTFLVDVAGLQKDRLWISVFSGGVIENNTLPADTQTLPFWIDHGFQKEKAVKLGIAENFWREGGLTASGRPRFCGPQVEVFFDSTEKPCALSSRCQPSCSCGRFIELTNVISISYQLRNGNEIEALSHPLCESVVGIERVLMARERCVSMVDVSYMRNALNHVIKNSLDLPKGSHCDLFEIFERLQAFCCLVAQGGVPGGKGRGYVLRRLFRSAFERADALAGDPGGAIRTFVDNIVTGKEVFGVGLGSKGNSIRRVVDREIALAFTAMGNSFAN